MLVTCDCTARASSCSASTAELWTRFRQFEFTPRRRPRRNRKQYCSDHEVESAEKGSGRHRTQDLAQREIGGQLQHQQAECGDQRRECPQAEADN